MISLLSASGDERIVVLDVSFGAPVRHVIAPTGENVAPLNIGAIPASKLVPWLRFRSRWKDRAIRIFPDVINQAQIMATPDQITLRMICKPFQDCLTAACNQILIGLIGRHHTIPFLIKFSPCLEICPNRYGIFPIQVAAFVQRNAKRISLRCFIWQKG